MSEVTAMTKVHVTALVQRHVARTFNLGLLLIIIGVVPLFLSQSSKVHTPYLFTTGVGLVTSGTILFTLSALLMLLVKITPGASGGPEDLPACYEQQIWTIPVDSPPSYEEALSMSQSRHVCADHSQGRTVVLSVPGQVSVDTGASAVLLEHGGARDAVLPQQRCSDC
ncbi:uncharacterized protein LOC135391965 isoform X2 [Ornithodoros turicata]|uniref:uncharacterized protein LOC135391965 isoform X2 n=1 Tax=Ornithodoros turicata TaxID=34597 RepID=UPI0031391164